MAQNPGYPARVEGFDFAGYIQNEGHDFLNVEGNMEAQLLGRNMDDSTPLLQHDNVYIRVPTRIAYAIQQAIVENLGRLVMLLALLGGLSLAFVAATSQEFRPMLVMAAAIIFIFSATIFNATRTRS